MGGSGGFAQMEPGAVEQHMRALGASGDELRDGWQRAQDDVAGHEPGIGGDLLGQAFRPRYTATSDGIRGIANPLPDRMRKLGDDGVRSADMYRDADATSAGHFPR